MLKVQLLLAGACVAVAAAASGPGTYAHYVLPSTPAGATDMAHGVRWVVEPSATERHGNAVFASTQMWMAAGPGGYMGTQRWLDTSSGRMVSKALFSMWDASDTIMTGWRGPNCERFGGEGTGAHCLIDFDTRPNISYTVRLAADGANSSGAFWTGSVTDTSSGATTVIGTLFHPNFNGHVGYGSIQVQAASFVEYFLADGCDNQAVSGIGLIGPSFNNNSIVASQASPDYAGDCLFDDVTGCIPGLGCGAPYVYLTAGGQTQRTTPKDTPLW